MRADDAAFVRDAQGVVDSTKQAIAAAQQAEQAARVQVRESESHNHRARDALAVVQATDAEKGLRTAAIQEALRGVSRELMRNHLRHCAATAIRRGDAAAEAMYDELVDLMFTGRQ